MSAAPIRFTPHALSKLRQEGDGGFDVNEQLVTEIPHHPNQVVPVRGGRTFAQSPIDERHLLRLLFEVENEGLVIITVYIGARRLYEI